MGGEGGKKTLVIVIDLVIMGLILFFIIQYANTKMHESNESVMEAFEKMTAEIFMDSKQLWKIFESKSKTYSK